MTENSALADRVRNGLTTIYGDRAQAVLPRVLELVARHESVPSERPSTTVVISADWVPKTAERLPWMARAALT